MSVATSPYKIDRGQHAPGKYINYCWSTEDNSYSDYLYTNDSDVTLTLPGHGYTDGWMVWHPYHAYYHALAYGISDGWALWGNHLSYNTEYNVMGGSPTTAIITNGHTGAILNFTTAGTLEVTPSDTVNVKAVSGTVTVNNSMDNYYLLAC